MRALNALRYPTGVQRQKRFHHWWTACAGWCVGVVLAWGWQHGQEIQTQALQQTHSRLQSDWEARQQQTKNTAVLHNQGRTLQAQAVLLQQIADHQQAWVALHDRLQQEATNHGLQLARLQVERDKIELQGHLSQLADMALVRQRVSDHLPQALAMTRMTADPMQDWGFIWQSAWLPAQPSRLTGPATPAALSFATPATPSSATPLAGSP